MDGFARRFRILVCLAALSTAFAAESEVLSNETIVRMCSLGLGQDVVVAKINQAERFDFKLDSSSLLDLRDRGVPQPVIVAMLNRAARGPSAPPAGASPPGDASPAAPVVSPPAAAAQPATEAGPRRERPAVQTSVRVIEGAAGATGATAAELTPGTITGTPATAYVPFRRVSYLHFPGASANVRTNADRLQLIVQDSVNPEGRWVLVALSRDPDKERRALRMTTSGPHADWTVPFDPVEESPGRWRLQPRKILGAGEYGLFGPGAQLHDFGVDEPAAGEPSVARTDTVEFSKTMLLDLPLADAGGGAGKRGRSGVDVTDRVRNYRCDRVSFSRLSIEDRSEAAGPVEMRVRGRLIKPRREELILRVGADLICGGRRVASSPPRVLTFEDEAASDVPWSATLEAAEKGAGADAGCLIRLRVQVSEN